jgi:hypothetical protein
MRKAFHVVVGLGLFAASISAASAQDSVKPGSARAGREFAIYNCDACHIVAANQDIRPLSAAMLRVSSISPTSRVQPRNRFGPFCPRRMPTRTCRIPTLRRQTWPMSSPTP